MMKRLLTSPALPLLFAVIPLMAAGSLRAEPQPAAAVITVAFDTGGKPGAVRAALFEETAYGRGAPVHGEAAPSADGAARITFPAVKPGRYAIKAFLDVNGDGKLSLNPLGMPIEPFGFSNGAEPHMGQPAWDEASFDAPAGAVAQTIVLR